MSALVLLDLSNELMKNDKLRACRSFYRFFAIVYVYTKARLFDLNSVYHMSLQLL